MLHSPATRIVILTSFPIRTDRGAQLQLRVSADTDIEGIADRTGLREGMRLSVLYQGPDGMNPALGYDALELKILP